MAALKQIAAISSQAARAFEFGRSTGFGDMWRLGHDQRGRHVAAAPPHLYNISVDLLPLLHYKCIIHIGQSYDVTWAIE